MIATPKKKEPLFWIGLALPVVAPIAMTWLVHKLDDRFNNSFNWVIQNYKVLDLFGQTQSSMVDTGANERGYLLTGPAEYLEPYRAAMALWLVLLITLAPKKLQEIVTLYAWTGRVRFEGQWLRLDEYLKRQFNISVWHGFSQAAAQKIRREIEELNRPFDRSLRTADQ